MPPSSHGRDSIPQPARRFADAAVALAAETRQMIVGDDRVELVMLPLRDGVALARKR
jgi:predicted O-methyltransferase YrrM